MRNARKAAIGYSTYVISRRLLRRAVMRKLRRDPPRSTSWRKPVAGATAAAIAVGAAGAVAVRRRRRQPVEHS